jgi:hypothetical protein
MPSECDSLLPAFSVLDDSSCILNIRDTPCAGVRSSATSKTRTKISKLDKSDRGCLLPWRVSVNDFWRYITGKSGARSQRQQYCQNGTSGSGVASCQYGFPVGLPPAIGSLMAADAIIRGAGLLPDHTLTAAEEPATMEGLGLVSDMPLSAGRSAPCSPISRGTRSLPRRSHRVHATSKTYR